MSNRQNYRRGEILDRTEHGSRWEGDDNSKCCSHARSSWKRLRSRVDRREPEKLHNKFWTSKNPRILDLDVQDVD